MLRVETGKWGHTPEDLRRLSVAAAHRRTRERFQALYAIAAGDASASTWAVRTGRENETVMGWVRRYNVAGPDALAYRRTGGRAPLLPRRKSSRSPTPSSRLSRPTTNCPATPGP